MALANLSHAAAESLPAACLPPVGSAVPMPPSPVCGSVLWVSAGAVSASAEASSREVPVDDCSCGEVRAVTESSVNAVLLLLQLRWLSQLTRPRSTTAPGSGCWAVSEKAIAY